MTLPNRPNYTPGEKRRERKYQLGETTVSPTSSQTDGNSPQSDQSESDESLREELLQALSSFSSDQPRSMQQSDAESRAKVYATLRADAENARQRLIGDSCFQKLSNRDDFLSMTMDGSSFQQAMSDSDPLDHLLSSMSAETGLKRSHSVAQNGRLDPQWVSLFSQVGPEREHLLRSLDKLQHPDISSIPELHTAMNIMHDPPMRGKYQRAVNSMHDWGRQSLYHQLRASGMLRSAPTSPIESPLRQQPKKRANLSKHAKIILREWFEEHLHHPYPTEEEKDWLAMQGGITIEQVNNWFINTRGRKWKPMINRLMAQKQAGGESKLYDKMVEKIEEPYRRTDV